MLKDGFETWLPNLGIENLNEIKDRKFMIFDKSGVEGLVENVQKDFLAKLTDKIQDVMDKDVDVKDLAAEVLEFTAENLYSELDSLEISNHNTEIGTNMDKIESDYEESFKEVFEKMSNFGKELKELEKLAENTQLGKKVDDNSSQIKELLLELTALTQHTGLNATRAVADNSKKWDDRSKKGLDAKIVRSILNLGMPNTASMMTNICEVFDFPVKPNLLNWVGYTPSYDSYQI